MMDETIQEWAARMGRGGRQEAEVHYPALAKTVTRTVLEDERHMGDDWRRRLLEMAGRMRTLESTFSLNATEWRHRAAHQSLEGDDAMSEVSLQAASFNDGLAQGMRIAIGALEYEGVTVR